MKLKLGKAYERIGNIKDKVIKPALADINKHSNLNVAFGQRKAGRRVTHFQFVITQKPGMQETPKKKVKKLPKQRKIGWNEFVRLHKAPAGIETLAAAKARLKPEYQEYLKQGELSL